MVREGVQERSAELSPCFSSEMSTGLQEGIRFIQEAVRLDHTGDCSAALSKYGEALSALRHAVQTGDTGAMRPHDIEVKIQEYTHRVGQLRIAVQQAAQQAIRDAESCDGTDAARHLGHAATLLNDLAGATSDRTEAAMLREQAEALEIKSLQALSLEP